MNPIQTEIRFSDLLALVKTAEVKFYICHNVAYMLKGELEKNEDFAEKFAKLKESQIQWVRPDLINSGYYFYIYNTMEDNFHSDELALCSQVMAQLNHYIQKIFPDALTWQYNLSDTVLQQCVDNHLDMMFAEYQLKSRIGLLEKILEIDPEAVISINL